MRPPVSDSPALIRWHFLPCGVELLGEGNAAIEGRVESLDLLVREFHGELVEVVAFPPVGQFAPGEDESPRQEGAVAAADGDGLRIFFRFARRSTFTRAGASSARRCSSASDAPGGASASLRMRTNARATGPPASIRSSSAHARARSSSGIAVSAVTVSR